MKQALQKLGEIPLVDYYIDICNKSMKDLREKVIQYERFFQVNRSSPFPPNK